jgi:hypothetical protein
MKAYAISYDLDRPGQNYTRLIARLQQHGAKRILMSQWALKTTWSAIELRNDLQANGGIDGNDRLVITEVNSNWASYNLLLSGKEFEQIAA